MNTQWSQQDSFNEGFLIRQFGDIQDYADLARLGFVARARINQIMNLLNLAPDIQKSYKESLTTLDL